MLTRRIVLYRSLDELMTRANLQPLIWESILSELGTREHFMFQSNHCFKRTRVLPCCTVFLSQKPVELVFLIWSERSRHSLKMQLFPVRTRMLVMSNYHIDLKEKEYDFVVQVNEDWKTNQTSTSDLIDPNSCQKILCIGNTKILHVSVGFS